MAEASTRVGRGAVPRADPQQPSQQQRDVRAEHPAVGVALVDDDVAQPAQERRPAGVPGQHRAVQHVRVAEHPAAVPPGPVALVERGVAVQRGRPHVGEVELGEGPQLVGGQRLGRREVQGGGAGVGGERGEHRQLVGQRLAGRGAGRHHDVLSGVGQLGGSHLVGPRGAHAVVDQRVAHRRGHPARPVRGPPGAGGHPHDVAQRGELAAVRQHRRSPRARAPAGRSPRPCGGSTLPRSRPPRSRPPRLAHDPPEACVDPSVRPDVSEVRGMSQRCHGRRRTARRPGQSAPPGP